jgi:hypothetical protein
VCYFVIDVSQEETLPRTFIPDAVHHRRYITVGDICHAFLGRFRGIGESQAIALLIASKASTPHSDRFRALKILSVSEIRFNLLAAPSSLKFLVAGK